mmetsp:Transcript_11338/g.17543  ORF Transcript_11338/g.17543 Transcript_11338/m.17543 type:complete len:171 (-) Transcript_11338:268-780(-)
MCLITNEVQKNEMTPPKKVTMKNFFSKSRRQTPPKPSLQDPPSSVSSTRTSESSPPSSPTQEKIIKNIEPLQKQVSKVFKNLQQSLISNLHEELENERAKVEHQKRIENRKLYGVVQDLNRERSTSSLSIASLAATMNSEESPHEQLQHFEKTTLVPDQNNIFHDVCLAD